MRLHVLALVVALALAPGALQAQTSSSQSSAGGSSETHLRLSQGSIDAMIPLLQAESVGSNSLDTRLAARAMTRPLYFGNRNALFIARLDAADPSRLRRVTGPALQVREANAALYRTNAARLDPVLSKLHSDPGCDLCTAPAAGTTRAR